MAESAFSAPLGAEISERSSELVLPEQDEVVDGDAVQTRAQGASRASVPVNGRVRSRASTPGRAGEVRLSEAGSTTHSTTAAGSGTEESAEMPSGGRDEASSGQTRGPKTSTPRLAQPVERGRALPGDRGPRVAEAPSQRPSFWRRISLGRRAGEASGRADSPPREATDEPPRTRATSPGREPEAPSARTTTGAVTRVEPSAMTPQAALDAQLLDKRIVEPMLQALVSVEAKLERSHSDLTTRSDQVEQRLTQLWDIEEQLGALGELQDSLTQVSEQQRRLETAVVAQTRTIRWLVGAVFFSLAAAAFVVAAVLR